MNLPLFVAWDDRNPFANAFIFDKAVYCEFDQVAATQLAVDGDLEQSQISQIANKFQPCP